MSGGRARAALKSAAATLAAAVLGAALILGGAEALLRWRGFGESTRFFTVKRAGDAAWRVTNRAFYQQFSALPLDRIMGWDDLDFQVPEKKAPGAVRVFVFGSSAVHGPRSAPRILEVMLRAAAPGVRWEIYNAACPGMNSNTMRAAARACASLEPDLFLVYMGNNEAVGPYGPTTALAAHPLLWRPAVIQALVAANNLRLAQWAAGPGVKPWQAPDRDALAAMAPGPTQNRRALEIFGANLSAMCRAARGAGVPVVLCSLAHNKRVGGVPQTDPPPPEGVLTLNRVIRSAAEQNAARGAAFCDVEKALAEADPEGLPGYEFFDDVVHFKFDGAWLAARAMFESVRRALPPETARRFQDAPPLEKGECARRLGWTEAAEYELLQYQVQARFEDYPARLIKERHDALAAKVGGDWRNLLCAGYAEACALTPDDMMLRRRHAASLLESGRFEEVLAGADAMAAACPAARTPLRLRAQALARLGRDGEADAAFGTLLSLYPDDPAGVREEAARLLAAKNWAGAEALYARRVQADPMETESLCGLAAALEGQGRDGEAGEALATAMRRDPGFAPAFRALDALWKKTFGPAERAQRWRAVLDRDDKPAPAWFQHGEALADGEQWAAAAESYRQAEQRNPFDHLIPLQLGRALAHAGDRPGAAEAMRRAIRMSPQFAGHACGELAALFADAGDGAGAEEQRRWCAELGIAMPQDQQ